MRLAGLSPRYGWFDGSTVMGRVVRNSGWLLSSSVLGALFSFAQSSIVARLLGATDFGIVALVLSLTAAVSSAVDSRVWEAATKYVIGFQESGESDKARAVIKVCFGVDAATAVAAFLLITIGSNWAASRFLHQPGGGDLIRLFSLSLLVSAPIGTCSALLRIADRFKLLAAQNAALSAARLVGGAAALLLGGGVRSILWVYVATVLLQTLMLCASTAAVVRSLGLSGWLRVPVHCLKGHYRELAGFLCTSNVSASIKMVRQRADVLLIGFFLTPAAVGYYQFARQITGIMTFPVAPLYTTSYPEFSRLWHQRRTAELAGLVRKLSLSSIAFGVASLAGIALMGHFVVRVIAGDAFLPAVPVLTWLAVGVTVAMAVNFFHPVLLAAGRASTALQASVLGAAAQLVALAVLLPSLGIVGAGLATVAYSVVFGAATIGPVWRVLHTRFAASVPVTSTAFNHEVAESAS